MESSDLSEILTHMYDPVKAREYYLRTRELVGRKPGQTKLSEVKSTLRRQTSQKPIAAKVAVKPKESRKQVQARVAALEARLDRLRELLRILVKQAKARSGVVTPDKDDPKSASKAKGSSKLTAAQKAKKAKEAKEAYEKEKNKAPDQKVKELNEKIAEVTAKITKAKAEIAAAKSKSSKRPSSSVGARANYNK